VRPLLLVTALAVGCATSAAPPVGSGPVQEMAPVPGEPQPLANVAPPPPQPPPTPVPEPCTSFVRPGVLKRQVLNQTLDAGLGRWLSGVEVDAGKFEGRFRGWVIRRLYPGDTCYADVDLRPGDLVLRVNGRPIERPEQASELWSALRSASAIVVEYVRDGQPRRLQIPIANE
jgi:S1-C subfamily serine protease